MDFLAIPTPAGALARLEPLLPEHAEALSEAVQDGQLHQLWYARVPAPTRMGEDIEDRLAGSASAGRLGKGTPMLKVVHDAEVSQENTTGSSLLDEIVRDGARQMLAAAL